MSHDPLPPSPVAVSLSWRGDLTFSVHFEDTTLDDTFIDETHGNDELLGPTPSQLLGAAVAGCLASSLLFCMGKKGLAPGTFTARAEVIPGRDPQGRLRIEQITVHLQPTTPDPAVAKRLVECQKFFETYCTITESVRAGIAVNVVIDT